MDNQQYKKKIKIQLFNDHFENAKTYGIPHAQLIIADIPYNLGNNAYASNPTWYIGGDIKNGESELAGKQFIGKIWVLAEILNDEEEIKLRKRGIKLYE